MGAASYKLHNACPELNARYMNCQALVFENSLTPQTAKNADGTPAPPQVFRDGKVVTNAADVALTLDALDPSSGNYRCKDMWLDYTECVKEVMAEHKKDYERRKAEAAAKKEANK